MPEISRFFGIVITMYYRDHSPPHFHAFYGDHEGSIEISTGWVTGELPSRALSMVQEWRVLHRQDLMHAWTLATAQQPLPTIAPLE